MKIAAARVDGFLEALNPAVHLLLIYGDDTGLVRERAQRAARAIVPDPDDPFRIVQLTAKQISDDPAVLSDEAAAISFGGGRRVIRVIGAGDNQSKILKAFLDEAPGDALVLVEAPMLSTRSSLRKLAETSDLAAALPCFADDSRSLRDVAKDTLAQHGLTLSPEAEGYLLSNLGNDRLVTRSELEKLALYMAGPERDPAQPVSLEEAAACIGGSDGPDMDDFVYAVGAGQTAETDRVLHRLFGEGVNVVAILRALGRHFMRLQSAAGAPTGQSARDIARTLKPPVFGPRADQLVAQAQTWPATAVNDALFRISDAEAACKTTGAPDRLLCSRLALSLASSAGARGRR